MGISIAIDDFGTGYLSLYYLKNLPINRIKIAKELIDCIDTDVYSKSIIQMLISVAAVFMVRESLPFNIVSEQRVKGIKDYENCLKRCIV